MPDDLTPDTDQDTPDAPEEATQVGDNADTDDGTDDGTDDDGQTYPASVVKGLRKEAASYRERSKTAEARVTDLEQKLFAVQVDATGRLASATDLSFDAALVDDDEALNAAIDELLAERPHYAKARRPAGNLGQGELGQKTAPADFAGLFG